MTQTDKPVDMIPLLHESELFVVMAAIMDKYVKKSA